MKKIIIISVLVLALLIILGLGINFINNIDVLDKNGKDIKTQKLGSYLGKKVLYIDSYHEGYEWSDGITRGVKNILDDTGVDLKIHRLDTKRNTSEEFKKTAAIEAKYIIEKFQPDVLIVSDDNAFKYLVMPYYRDADLPVVFSGLNWDASLYEAPYSNTTGMVEVSLTVQLIDFLKEYSTGSKVGYLSADVLTERKNAEYYKKLFNFDFDKKYFVGTMEDWKEKLLQLQKEVDLIIFENNAGIVDWDGELAETFMLENIEIPIGTTNFWLMNYALLGFSKVPEEQGEWSAEAALNVIDGTSPEDIPLVVNKKGRLLVNLKIAKRLDIVIAPSVLKNAEIIE